MGQKINPIGLRLGINRTWDSRWYGAKDYPEMLHQDFKIREHLFKKLSQAGVAKIVIERLAKKPRVSIYAAKPGMIIGKKGGDIEKLKSDLTKIANAEVTLNIVELRKPETNAKLVAEGIAQQLEKRVAFRRAMKRAIQSAQRYGAQGIRIACSGRLGGAEIARIEKAQEGKVPLHTLRADIEFHRATAHTTYGSCGVKVWIYKGDVMTRDITHQDKAMSSETARSGK